jgi:ABC-2 type transport system permease protein
MRVGWRTRVQGLVLKDAAELWRHPGAMIPAISMAIASLIPGFLVAIVVPMLSGETLEDSEDFAEGAALAIAMVPELARLEGGALVQAFLFHQFGLLLLLVPIVGSMALAAHAVIGEKLARALEPLLATPLSTAELLSAKTITPFGFSIALMLATLGLYIGGIALVGEPGVWGTFVGPRSVLLFLLLGPLLTLLALLLAVIISSRVNDPRSAQQLGTLVILPVVCVFIAQLVGQFVLGPGALLLTAAGVGALDALLLWVGVLVFDRERILMRWK